MKKNLPREYLLQQCFFKVLPGFSVVSSFKLAKGSQETLKIGDNTLKVDKYSVIYVRQNEHSLSEQVKEHKDSMFKGQTISSGIAEHETCTIND